MALKQIQPHALGLSWVMDDAMQRASHALLDEGRVWYVDPVDVPEALEAAGALGEPAGVIQLLDRHERDCAALAERFGVPHLKLSSALPGTPFEVVGVLDTPLWVETALWWPARKAVVIAETVGSAPMFALGDTPLGAHPMLRLLTPGGKLADHEPEWVLVGHGPPVHGPGTAAALRSAFADARGDLPKLVRALPGMLRSSS